MCKGGSPAQQQTNSSQTTAPNGQAMQMYSDLLSRAQGVSNTPYTPYSGEMVAPLTGTQQQGIANVNQGTGLAMPAFQQAIGIAGNAAQPLTQGDVQSWVNPWTQNVVDATQNQFNNQNSQQQQQLKGNQIAQGALGSSRNGVSQAILSNQQQLAQAPVIAGLNSQGYQQGVNTALAAKGSAMSGAQGLAGLGAGAQNIGMQQLGAGTVEQQTQQAGDTANYQQWLTKQAYPFQTAQWLAGLGTGVGSQMGGTTYGNSTGTNMPAGPSPFSQILGAGTTAASMAMMMGMAIGGRVQGLAGGGRAEGVAAGHSMTIPESLDTLMLQQQQLIDGQRKVQMFPIGTPELPLPRGLQRLETPVGILHYNPAKISFEELQHLIQAERENEFLDLGPHNKQDILDRVNKGEKPLALVERNPEGIEARAAIGTESTLPAQWEAMNAAKSPDHELHIEDPSDTLQRRCGGAIPGYALGGSPGMDGRSEGVAGAPYGGAMGWVPSIGLTKGNTMPQSSGAASMKDPGVADGKIPNMDSVGALGKSIFDSLQPQQQGGNYDLNMSGMGQTGPTGFLVGGNAQGGRVEGIKGYAQGGGPWDDGGPIPADWAPTPPPREEQPPVAAPPVEQPGVAVAPPMQGFGDAAPIAQDVPVQGFGDEPQITSGNGTSIPIPRPRPAGVEAGVPVDISPASGGRTPRGIRNNNPGNIEDGPFARSQPGYTGSDGRFATFETPTAGIAASKSLLAGYGNKGFNTVSSIINRWAPAADNNNTGAYIQAVSRATGYAPDQPLDMNDPTVQEKLSLAIAKHENGTGVAGLNSASGYNRGVVPSDDNAQYPSHSTPAGPMQTADGVAGTTPSKSGVDWSSNSKLWPALMAAGLGMMASRSPHAGVAIGEGGLAGLGAYTRSKQTETENAFERERIDRSAKQLSNQMDYQNRSLNQAKDFHYNPVATPLSDYQKQQLVLQKEDRDRQWAKEARENTKPITLKTSLGEFSAIPLSPTQGGGYKITDPGGKYDGVVVGGRAGASAAKREGNAPGEPDGGGFQTIAFDPDKAGVYRANNNLIASGNTYDYSNGAPRLEKGLMVPEPEPVAGKSVRALQQDAQTYFETGKLPKTSGGKSPVAIQQQKYADAVKNYAGAQAEALGYTVEQITDMHRSAPGMLRFIMGADGRTTVALGTAMRHLDTMRDYAKAWDAGNVQLLNRARAELNKQFGGEAATNLDAVGRIVGPEIIKAIGVAGAGTEKERADIEKAFSTASSGPQIMGAILATQKLLAGQLVGKRNQANAAGVTNDKFKTLVGAEGYDKLDELAKHEGAGSTSPPPAKPKEVTQNGWVYQEQPDGKMKAVRKAQ